MLEKDIETFYPKTKQEWRQWLKANHKLKQSVWLIQYKKQSGKPTISWSDAVDEALCFGWIDSVKRSRDEESSIQYFSKRKPKGTWSKINKDKVQLLIEQGLMTKAGLDIIEIAKKNGSWTILDQVEELVMPKDLNTELKNHPGAEDFYKSLSKSVKKGMLYWVMSARRPETRQKRIAEIAELAAERKKPKQF